MAIKTYEKLLTTLSAMNTNLPTYQAAVGATAADLTLVSNLLDNLEYLQNYSDAVDASKKGVFQIKQAAFNGDPKDSISNFPTFDAGALPNPAVKAGALEQVMNMIKRFKLAPGYTHEIGVALGFEDSGDGAGIDLTTWKPTIEVFASQSDYTLSVVVNKRAESDSWIVETMANGASGWTNQGTFTGKSADVQITPPTPGQAAKIQVRVRLRRKNENYGLVSDAVTVTVSP